ncbi:MAG: dihydropteroate synthase [Candidatus Omnitrophica bacterium]|nr:dihydropteroate synthase [Candidatus Omnitrophota bacterium]
MISRRCYYFQARDKVLILGKKTAVMGIVNVTPDSFSGDGQLKGKNFVRLALDTAVQMADSGADIIDIGGESTRPGSSKVSVKDESRRVVPVIEALVKERNGILVSVDTSKVSVAKDALKAGAHIVNVVQSNNVSCTLFEAVRNYSAGIVLMHMRGSPRTMQRKTGYDQFIPDIMSELDNIVKKALASGLNRNNIIVDPGIGFAKTASDNFLLLRELGSLKAFGLPILVGPSRKSFIGKLLNLKPSERLAGTLAAVVASVLQGAHIVRVHDVTQVKQAVSVTDAILLGGK